MVRGWRDDPLLPQSLNDARKTAKDLKQYAPQWIVSSEFMRDSQTAMVLADELGISDISADYDSRTWDVGEYSGQPEDQVNPAILQLYRRPWEPCPGSIESFNEFTDRWLGFLDSKMALASIESMRPGIIVTHGRNIALSDSHFNFKRPEDGYMPLPAGYGVLSVNTDRSLRFELQGDSEPVINDV